MTEGIERRAPLSVSELNAYASALMNADSVLRDLNVQGEISGFKRHSSGHLYFSLKDEEALVRCVMFRQNAMRLRFMPADGSRVNVRGYASIYGRDGSFQVYVQFMSKQGEGEMYARFLAYKAELEAQGFFAQSRKRPVPFLPACVGVVTSGTGAALQDVLQIIRRRFPSMHVCVYAARVQGEGAADDIARGIRVMNARSDADVLIVGRGGGSTEDLWAFNEPVVARAIFESRIPVISAVGHETDFSIADFVADLRAPTPSAAAELAVPSYADCRASVRALSDRIARSLGADLARRRDGLQLLARHPVLVHVPRRVAEQSLRIDALDERLTRAPRERLSHARLQLASLEGRLRAVGPDAVLARGFALVTAADGGVIGRAAALAPADGVTLRFYDGSARATVETVTTEPEG